MYVKQVITHVNLNPPCGFAVSQQGSMESHVCLQTSHLFLPLVFGLLGGSQELLDVFGDLLRLADDVLGARQRGVLHALLHRLGSVRGR